MLETSSDYRVKNRLGLSVGQKVGWGEWGIETRVLATEKEKEGWQLGEERGAAAPLVVTEFDELVCGQELRSDVGTQVTDLWDVSIRRVRKPWGHVSSPKESVKRGRV